MPVISLIFGVIQEQTYLLTYLFRRKKRQSSFFCQDGISSFNQVGRLAEIANPIYGDGLLYVYTTHNFGEQTAWFTYL